MQNIKTELLIAAREGLAAKLAEFQGHIAAIDRELRGEQTRKGNPVPVAERPAKATAAAAAPAGTGKRRKLSAAARKRISAAQKKRWSEYAKTKASKEKK